MMTHTIHLCLARFVAAWSKRHRRADLQAGFKWANAPWQMQDGHIESVSDPCGTMPLAVRRKTKKELVALIRTISKQSITEKFHMTQKQAAHEFGIGLTTLRKICAIHVIPVPAGPFPLQPNLTSAHSHVSQFP
jgi:hypothetical protein